MKPLIIVSTYIYNKETESILNTCLDDLKKTGYDILIVANSKIKSETLNKCDYYLFISDAIFFGDNYSNIPEIDFWFGCDKFDVHHFMPSYQRYGLSVLRNLFTSLDLAKSFGYDSFFLFTGDNYFGDKSIEFIKKVPNLCQSQNKKCMIYFNDYDVSSVPIYSEINYFLEKIKIIKSEDEYKDFLIRHQGNLDFLDVERFLYLNLMMIDDDLVLRMDGHLIMNDFPDTKFNLVTGVYNTSKKYNGCLTGLFRRLDSEHNQVEYWIFSRNLKSENVTRKIEVYFNETDLQVLEYEMEPFIWFYHAYPEVYKIKVYENDIFLFEEYQTKNYITFK